MSLHPLQNAGDDDWRAAGLRRPADADAWLRACGRHRSGQSRCTSLPDSAGDGNVASQSSQIRNLLISPLLWHTTHARHVALAKPIPRECSCLRAFDQEPWLHRLPTGFDGIQNVAFGSLDVMRIPRRHQRPTVHSDVCWTGWKEGV